MTGQNLVYQLSANDGKGNDLSKTNNEIGVGARQKLSSNKHSHSKNFLSFMRNRDCSFNVHDIGYSHERRLCVEECDYCLRSEK